MVYMLYGLGCIKRWISIGCSGFIGIYGWGTYVNIRGYL